MRPGAAIVPAPAVVGLADSEALVVGTTWMLVSVDGLVWLGTTDSEVMAVELGP